MKKIRLNWLLILIIAMSPTLLNAQDCVDYHKVNCKPPQSAANYTTDQASRSGLLMKGQSSEFRITFYQGRDYRITICNEAPLGDKVQYQIIDWEDQSVLYDSKVVNDRNEMTYERNFEFSVLITRSVKIVVSVPADDKTLKTNTIGFKPKPTQMGCVGVLIESMITPKKGF
jgi:hypothetical protein